MGTSASNSGPNDKTPLLPAWAQGGPGPAPDEPSPPPPAPDGQDPAAQRRFGELNVRGVPLRALLLSTAGIALAAVLNALYPDASFTLMMAISMFGAMFTWLMIFITHLFFRRRHRDAVLGFRMWGYPYTSLAGAGLMIGTLLTTAFTREFRMTLVCGVPFLLVLAGVFLFRDRHATVTPLAAPEAQIPL